MASTWQWLTNHPVGNDTISDYRDTSVREEITEYFGEEECRYSIESTHVFMTANEFDEGNTVVGNIIIDKLYQCQ